MRPEAVEVAVLGVVLGVVDGAVGTGGLLRPDCVLLPSSRVAPKAVRAPVTATRTVALRSVREIHKPEQGVAGDLFNGG